jgi:hypothetical protein
MSDDFTLEVELAKMLGVSREKLAEVRARVLGQDDWQKTKNAVALTPAGVEKIRAALAVPPPLPGLPSPGANQSEPQTVYVRRRAQRNVHVIFASVKKWGAGDPYDHVPELAVRVRDNRHFTLGQEIRIQADGAGVWHLHGHQPRTRGKLRIGSRRTAK